jgi:hypothetical protein
MGDLCPFLTSIFIRLTLTRGRAFQILGGKDLDEGERL